VIGRRPTWQPSEPRRRGRRRDARARRPAHCRPCQFQPRSNSRTVVCSCLHERKNSFRSLQSNYRSMLGTRAPLATPHGRTCTRSHAMSRRARPSGPPGHTTAFWPASPAPPLHLSTHCTCGRGRICTCAASPPSRAPLPSNLACPATTRTTAAHEHLVSHTRALPRCLHLGCPLP
jgi:hypothetical protein